MKLKTKGKMSHHGKPCRDTEIHLIERGGKPVVRVEGTPASWYLSTFMGATSSKIWVDMGQQWALENVAEIQKELVSGVLAQWMRDEMLGGDGEE